MIITLAAMKRMLKDYNPEPDPLFVDACILDHPAIQSYARRTGRKIMTYGDIPKIPVPLWRRLWAEIMNLQLFGGGVMWVKVKVYDPKLWKEIIEGRITSVSMKMDSTNRKPSMLKKIGRVVGVILAATMLVTGGYGLYGKDTQTIVGSAILFAVGVLVFGLSQPRKYD